MSDLADHVLAIPLLTQPPEGSPSSRPADVFLPGRLGRRQGGTLAPCAIARAAQAGAGPRVCVFTSQRRGAWGARTPK